jgi:signal transduction histidine kinase
MRFPLAVREQARNNAPYVIDSPAAARPSAISIVLSLTVVLFGVGFALSPGRAHLVGVALVLVLIAEIAVVLYLRQRVEPALQAPLRRASFILGRRLVLAKIATLAGFGITLAYGYWALAPASMRTNAIVLNALPSARACSLARSDIMHLQTAMQALLVREHVDPSAFDDVDAARTKLEADVAAALATPEFPGEADVEREMLPYLVTLDAETTVALQVARTAPLDARMQAFHRWLEYETPAEAAIAKLLVYNLEGGDREARSLMAVENHTQMVTISMFGATLVVSILAAYLLLRLIRVQADEVALQERLLVNRANELEAFAGRVAHDLRDPLGALSMRLGAMRSRVGRDAPELERSLDKAASQIERMDALLAALLEFARSGAQPTPGASAELQVAVERVVEELTPAAKTAKVELRVDPFAPERVACTPGALTSVLANLLGNAVKYIVESRQPVRRIRVHVEDRSESVRVEVEDNGPGLPPGADRTVFEPFVRMTTTRQPGTGLGLANVRKIVEAYGGQVGVRSELGAGSCFWFEMPKASGEA